MSQKREGKTKSVLIESAIEILSEDPSSNLDHIAVKADVSRRTLHRYFESREVMIRACAQEIMSEILKDVKKASEINGSALDRLRRMLDDDIAKGKQFEFCQKFSEYFKEEHIQKQFKEMGELFYSLLDELKWDDTIDSSLSNEWLSYLWMGIIRSTNQALSEGVIAAKKANDLAWFAFAKGVIKE